MKLPCETIIVDILPIIRKELAIELVETHQVRKASVARMFGISGTAISQYIYGLRGNRSLMENSRHYDMFMKEISASAESIVTKKSTVADELCRLCSLAKSSGIVDEVSSLKGGYLPASVCPECPGNSA